MNDFYSELRALNEPKKRKSPFPCPRCGKIPEFIQRRTMGVSVLGKCVTLLAPSWSVQCCGWMGDDKSLARLEVRWNNHVRFLRKK